MSVCGICLDPPTRVLRREITCPSCSTVCCMKCVRAYAAASPDMVTEEGIRCSSCKTLWTFRFLASATPLSFYDKQLRSIHARQVLEHEKSLLPATTELANIEKRRRELLKLKTDPGYFNVRACEITAELRTLSKKKRELTGCKPTPELTLIVHCTRPGCRGYVRDSVRDPVCGLCGEEVCAACFCSKRAEHTCDPVEVESVKTILGTTKACPKCSARICKIGGCSQVFCSVCKTPFDYNTGEVALGHIHAPGYHEWLAQQEPLARQPLLQRCNEVPLFSVVRQAARGSLAENIVKYYGTTVHVQHNVLPLYGVGNDFDGTGLRVGFLLHDFDESEWLNRLKKAHKRMEKKRVVHSILSTWVACMSDIFHEIVAHPEKYDEHEHEITVLRIIINEELNVVQQMFNSSVPLVDFNW